MITLFSIIVLGAIFGWIKRYNGSVEGIYELNPFKQEPTFWSMALIMSTLIVGLVIFFTIIVSIILYLP